MTSDNVLPLHGENPTTVHQTATPTIEIPEEHRAVFDRSGKLRTLFKVARAAGANPYAVLMITLARLSVAIAPHVVLPPLAGKGSTGSFGSLNLLIATVGKSGAGKGNAMAAVRQAVKIVDCNGLDLRIPEEPLGGSGEGFEEYYSQDPSSGNDEGKNGQGSAGTGKQRNIAALWNLSEVGTLVTTMQRKGGGRIAETLKQAWSGEQLGSVNATESTSRRVAEHSYRASAIMGVQPERAAGILEDNGGGFPQRFIWVDCHDKTAPATPRPTREELADEEIEQPYQREAGEVVTVKVPARFVSNTPEANWVFINRPQGVVTLLKYEKELNNRGLASDQYETHSRLNQLKVAALLSVLHEYEYMKKWCWDIAEEIMKESKRNRQQCLQVLAHGREQGAQERGRLQAVQSTARKSSEIETRLKDVLEGAGTEGIMWGALSQKFNPNQRDQMGEILKRLINDGHVIESSGARGSRVFVLARD